jgi:thiol-disulfide isomerase/thioredoxin
MIMGPPHHRTRRARCRRAVVAAALSLAGGLLSACTGDDDGATTAGGLTVGGLETVSPTVPDGSVAGLSFMDFDGKEGTFEQFVGKPLVVNFWGSWCTPCIKEMPDFEAVHQALGDAVSFVGVNVQDTVADASKMAELTGVTYPLVRDPRNELLAWFGGAGMPTTAFVNADGRVVEVVSKQLSPEALRAEIEAIR